ncbi:MAG: hypothetical protein ACI8ZB_000817 [Desulforhopalus sp.]|jgi:hypothetical protein
MRLLLILTLLFSFSASAFGEGFDHNPWNSLLQTHVKLVDGGKTTAVDYSGMQQQRELLTSYLQELSDVEGKEFYQWSTSDQLAFLINAYNGWTVELILTRYPDLKSIKDLGSFLQSPWKKKFIPLLGEIRSLDDIEHGLIRAEGSYNDPRIHFAVNCASIGCPALRPEAYRGDILEQQLQDAELLFLSDPSRNRFVDGVFEVSSIFKWYGDDFRKGWQGIDSLENYLLSHSELFGFDAKKANKPENKEIKIKFLKYDWELNSM